MRKLKIILAILGIMLTEAFSFTDGAIALMDKAFERKKAVMAIIGRQPHQREMNIADALPADIPLTPQTYALSRALGEAHLMVNGENIATAGLLEQNHLAINSQNINAVRALSSHNLEINSINIEAAAALPSGTPPTGINIAIAHSLLHPRGGGTPLDINSVNIETGIFLKGLGVNINANTLAAARAFNFTDID